MSTGQVGGQQMPTPPRGAFPLQKEEVRGESGGEGTGHELGSQAKES